ncbi:hypothetical protein [Pigmentibacter ruber]|uniref:hypothetical protein n=1 Tax=Pigmentibacter ruber TaxID=2683196 RepID=UPI00131B0358|nr:hypothetical protein [Pigmentibacter ruber]BFD30747.1 hypothetical protein GTC16762_03650 [Pigmentibacter ruber]
MKLKLLNATALLSAFFTPVIANAELSKCSEDWINSCLNTSDSLIGSNASGSNYDRNYQTHQMMCRGSFKDRESMEKIFQSLDKICIEICRGTPTNETISIKRNGPATGGHSCYVNQKLNMFSAFKLNQIQIDKLIEDKRIEADKLFRVDNQSDSFIYINPKGSWLY